jgi:serine/threonine protein kinase
VLLELTALAPLAHPNIVGFKGMLLRFPRAGSSSSDFELGLVFELCDGGNLHARMFAGSGHLLSYSDRLRIAREIAEAMAYVHGLNIIHRDLRPAPSPAPPLLLRPTRTHIPKLALVPCGTKAGNRRRG